MNKLATALMEAVPGKNPNRRLVQTVLYQCRDFAKSYASEDLKRITDLSWSKVRMLMAVSSLGVCSELEDACLANGWTSRELQKAIRVLRQNVAPEQFAKRDVRNSLGWIASASRRYRGDLGGHVATIARSLEHIGPEEIKNGLLPLVQGASGNLEALDGSLKTARGQLLKMATCQSSRG